MIRMLLLVILLSLLPSACTGGRNENHKKPFQMNQEAQDSITWARPRFEERKDERVRMVRDEIMKDPFIRITDKKVLQAMEAVPRHLFVPEEYRDQAYENHPLPIGYGQTISQPLIVALMTELLEISPGDRILEIGTGSGYQAAVLSELTPNVYTVEIVEELAERAKTTLAGLGYKTIRVKAGDGYAGWKEYAPYDGIIVTCAPEDIPQPLVDQLKTGGKIVIPVGKQGYTQWLVVGEKTKKGKIKKKAEYPVAFVPMTGKALKK